MPKLIVTSGDDSHEVALQSGDTVGRIASNAIQLKIAEASRKHCTFSKEQGAWWVEDNGSSNGTLVNGRRVTKFELQDGDVIQVGLSTLRFLMSEVEEEPDVEWGEDDISLEDKCFLILHGGGRDGEVMVLPEGRVTVGRKARHVLKITDVSVSGDHAELVNEGGVVTIRDLGSSNGTFINGRLMKEGELLAGDEVKFGAVRATYGVGDPDTVEIPAPSAVSVGAETRIMESAAIGDSAVFELHDLPPQKEGLWNILAIVLILGLGGGVFWLMTQSSGGGFGGVSEASSPDGNLVPQEAWSFEPQEDEEIEEDELLLWEKESNRDSGEMEEVGEPTMTGSTAYAVRRPVDEGPPSVAVLNRLLSVSGGQAYALSVSVFSTESQGIPLLHVRWLEERPEDGAEPVTVAVDRIYGESGDDGWTKISGVVNAPSVARFASLGVGMARTGRAVFDNISMVTSRDSGLGEGEAVSSFTPVFGPHGTLRLTRFGRIVLDGIGVVAERDGRLGGQKELLRVREISGAAVVGSLRDGLGDMRVDLSRGDGKLGLAFEGPGLGAAGKLRLPINAGVDDDYQVTLIAGDKARRFEEPFDKQTASALIIGLVRREGSDRVKIFLTDGTGPADRAVSLKVVDGRPELTVDVSGMQKLAMSFQLSFEKEEQEARDLVVKARGLLSRNEPGKAIQVLEEVVARFPFAPKIESEAAVLRDTELEKGRTRLGGLTRRVDDTLFFKTLSRSDDLETEVAGLRDSYAGTSLAPDCIALWETLSTARKDRSATSQEHDAVKAMARARDYMKTGKSQLALVFFTYIAAHLKDSEWAEQAEQAIQQIKKKSTSGGGR